MVQSAPLVAWVSRSSSRPPGHGAAMSWNNFWDMQNHLCNRTLSDRVRLQSLRAGILPVLRWVSAARHLRSDTIGAAVGAVMGMPRPMLLAQNQAEEDWIEWHRRTLREARSEQTKAWGGDPASVTRACEWRGCQAGGAPRLLGCGQILALALCGRCRRLASSSRRGGSEPPAN